MECVGDDNELVGENGLVLELEQEDKRIIGGVGGGLFVVWCWCCCCG